MTLATDQDIHKRLVGITLPHIRLPSTVGGTVDLGSLASPRTVIYGYPRTSEPGKPSPAGWNVIPGARGCTPQACTFRDHHQELASLGTAVFGLSTQSTAYQQEMVTRLHLSFPVLSDAAFELTDALGLPFFEVDGMRLLKQITFVVRGATIEAVLYPVQ